MDDEALLELLRARGKRLESGRAYDVLLEDTDPCGLWGDSGVCDCTPHIKVREVPNAASPSVPPEPHH